MNSLKTILVTLLFCFFVPAVWATTYYVDFSNGNDTNSGTSSTNAFKHSPGDSNASGIALSVTLSSGDEVVLKGGTTYTGMINIYTSSITYDGDSGKVVPRWGSGTDKAKIDLAHTYSSAFISSSTRNYIKIQNFDIFNAKNDSNEAIIKIGSGSLNWEINYLIIHETQDWNVLSSINKDGRPDTQTLGIDIDRASNITISNSEFYALGYEAIRIYKSDNVIIDKCNIGGINRGSATGYFNVGISIQSSDNVTIRDTHIHDGWQYNGDESAGQRSHAADWIHTFAVGGASGDPCENIIIERSFFYNNRQFLRSSGQNMIISETKGFIFRNNIVVNMQNLTNGMKLYADQVKMYNNLFITYPTVTGVSAFVIKFSDATSDCSSYSINCNKDVEVKNNIFISFGANPIIDVVRHDNRAVGDWPAEFKNNVYYIKASSSEKIIDYDPGDGPTVSYTLAEWQSTRLNRDANSSYGDPKISAIPPDGSSSANGDYHLTHESFVAVDTGLTLSGFSDDYDGRSRPYGSKWDIGPFEYSGAVEQVPAPPIKLRIK